MTIVMVHEQKTFVVSSQTQADRSCKVHLEITQQYPYLLDPKIWL